MTAIREFIKVKNHKLEIDLPADFNYDEVEVVIMPKSQNNYDLWSENELENIGKIGFDSSAFEEDDEDYTKW